MEVLTYRLPATKKIAKKANVGVVGSGDLEILMRPNSKDEVEVYVRTGVNGFKATWDAIIERFFNENDIAAKVTINDFGATPGVVQIRLAQALEVSGID